MTEREWMKEGIDLKLTALLFRKKLWLAAVWTILGAALAGGVYFLCHVIYGPAREYEAVSKLYLEFAADDDGDAYQYYNGYTWNDLMGTEPILDKISDKLPEFDKTEIRKAVTADILSDIRLLTITVRMKSPEKTEQVIRATEDALISFGQEMKEFDQIKVIEHGTPALVIIEDETVRAVLAGAVAGLILCLLYLAAVCVLDDSVYVPADVQRKFGLPVLGVVNTKNPEEGKAELDAALSYLTKDKKNISYLEAGTAASQDEKIPDYEALRKGDGIILKIPYGQNNGKIIERQILRLKLQDCHIIGTIIENVDPVLYRAYYRIKKRKPS